jgi:hypothetical protein
VPASSFKLQEDIFDFHLGRLGAYRMSPATSTAGSCMTKMQRQQWQRHIAETFASNKHNTNLESLESDSDSCCSSDSDFDGNIVLSD